MFILSDFPPPDVQEELFHLLRITGKKQKKSFDLKKYDIGIIKSKMSMKAL